MDSVELCRSWLKNGALFLDTETTGVDASAEIIGNAHRARADAETMLQIVSAVAGSRV